MFSQANYYKTLDQIKSMGFDLNDTEKALFIVKRKISNLDTLLSIIDRKYKGAKLWRDTQIVMKQLVWTKQQLEKDLENIRHEETTNPVPRN